MKAKTLTIVITIKDPELIEGYAEVDPAIIQDDFRDEPLTWLKGAEIKVIKRPVWHSK